VQTGGADCVEGAHTDANRRKKEKKLQRAAELLSLMQQDAEAARQIKQQRDERRLAEEAVHDQRMATLVQERADRAKALLTMLRSDTGAPPAPPTDERR
jgi:hypothetical protein